MLDAALVEEWATGALMLVAALPAEEEAEEPAEEPEDERLTTPVPMRGEEVEADLFAVFI